ncbi:MAG: hemerythrin family protein [Magnetococcales bacterium]|nr:hemerythrin family protein [Magnetococcales bacterium]
MIQPKWVNDRTKDANDTQTPDKDRLATTLNATNNYYFNQGFTVEDFRRNMNSRLKNVGVALLHDQHKRLVEILVKLYIGVRNLQKSAPNHENSTYLYNVIDELKDYALKHFRNEEEFMRKIKYSYIAEHMEAHKIFVESLLGLEKRMRQESVSYIIDLLHLVIGWLFQHINHMDMSYSKFHNGDIKTKAIITLHIPPSLSNNSLLRNKETKDDLKSKENHADLKRTLLRRLPIIEINNIDKEHMELINQTILLSGLAIKLTSGILRKSNTLKLYMKSYL